MFGVAESDEPTPITLRSVLDELHATRESLNSLEIAVHDQAEATRRSRLMQVGLAIVAAVTVILVFAVAIVTMWVYGQQKQTDSDLREFGRQLYLSACESQNAGRADARQNNIDDAEALILVTNSDVDAPEIAAEYRRLTQERNERLKDRDCLAELREVEG